MIELAGIVDEKLKILTDGDIRLELVIGLTESLQFHYKIYDKFNNFVGMCAIRLKENKKIEYLGNIEYTIFPKYRGNNYATKASNLLSYVAIYYGYNKITITAVSTNLASIKTIENLGARFIEVRKVPKNAAIYEKAREVNAYELDLERKIL